MYEKLEACPACQSNQFKNYQIVKDYSISQEDFVLQRCDSCDLIFTNPRPDEENITKYYEADHYISHSDKTLGLQDIAYKLVRSITLTNKIRLVQKLTSSKNLLDYGSGAGHFLRKAESQGYHVNGVEPNDLARKSSNELLSSSKVYKSLDKLRTQEFDIITLWHVLEHIHNLQTVLKTLKKMLHKAGFMIIAVPNRESLDAEIYRDKWAAWDVPRHLYHFNQRSLTQLMKKHKLRIRETRPMKFDSYYVSLLSEKYHAESKSSLKALANGFKSNKIAKKTGQYSSLIYIIQHA